MLTPEEIVKVVKLLISIVTVEFEPAVLMGMLVLVGVLEEVLGDMIVDELDPVLVARLTKLVGRVATVFVVVVLVPGVLVAEPSESVLKPVLNCVLEPVLETVLEPVPVEMPVVVLGTMVVGKMLTAV